MPLANPEYIVPSKGVRKLGHQVANLVRTIVSATVLLSPNIPLLLSFYTYNTFIPLQRNPVNPVNPINKAELKIWDLWAVGIVLTSSLEVVSLGWRLM